MVKHSAEDRAFREANDIDLDMWLNDTIVSAENAFGKYLSSFVHTMLATCHQLLQRRPFQHCSRYAIPDQAFGTQRPYLDAETVVCVIRMSSEDYDDKIEAY